MFIVKLEEIAIWAKGYIDMEKATAKMDLLVPTLETKHKERRN